MRRSYALGSKAGSNNVVVIGAGGVIQRLKYALCDIHADHGTLPFDPAVSGGLIPG